MKYTLDVRECARCGISKHQDQFYQKAGKPVGYCKPCKLNFQKRYKTDPEKSREYYKKNKKEIQERSKTRLNNNLSERVGRVVRNAKQRANKDGLEFSITYKSCIELFNSQDGKCALSGEPLELFGDRYLSNLMSLDRIDSTLGYTQDNVQWVCVKYNMMKAHANLKEFIEMCRKIVEYNNEV